MESKNPSENIPNELKESTKVNESFDVPLVKKLVSDDKLEKKIVVPTDAKIEPRPVNTARSVNTARPVSTARPVNTARPRPINTARPRPINTVRPRPVNTARPKSSVVNAAGQIRLMLLRPQHVGFGDLPNLMILKNSIEDMLPLGRSKWWQNYCVSQMCDKKNNVLFTDTECLVLSSNFKLPRENQILLRVPRRNDMYNVDMKNIIPKEKLTCLVVKSTLDESMLWHRRLGHINFKNINKLVKDNLVRGLPTKHFENDQTYVACLKRKQHKASLVTDDYSRFTWVFFLATKDETSGILKKFITEIENLVDKKVKVEVDNTACYVHNRVLVVKPHNKTPYELFRGRTPALSYVKPFGCHVTILNTLDHLKKFDGKSTEGFFVGYSLNSKAFRVYNIRNRKVEENLHIRFLEDKLSIVGSGPK
nr:ribonuclease H-like domain-containing protein [Tanacetum cinerariifolium]